MTMLLLGVGSPGGAASGPEPGMETWLARTGPYYQDGGKTVPATQVGDPVAVFEDSSGNGRDGSNPFITTLHLVAAPAGFGVEQTDGTSNQIKGGPAGITETTTIFLAFRLLDTTVDEFSGFATFGGTQVTVVSGKFALLGIAGINVQIAPVDTAWHVIAATIDGAGGPSIVSIDGNTPISFSNGAITAGPTYTMMGTSKAMDLGELLMYQGALSSPAFTHTLNYMLDWVS